MAKLTKQNKKKIKFKKRTGIKGVPVEAGYDSYVYENYFQYELEKQDLIKINEKFIIKNFSKEDSDAILSNSKGFYSYPYIARIGYWDINNYEPTKMSKETKEFVINKLKDLITSGKKILEENELKSKKMYVKSPEQKRIDLIYETVMWTIEDYEEKDDYSLDLYAHFRKKESPSYVVEYVINHINHMLSWFNDAHDKRCDQAIEMYSHLTKKELRERIEHYNKWLNDCNSYKQSNKPVKKIVRKRKPKPIEKLIEKLQYKVEDNEYKITSIDSKKIIGAKRIIMFNVKTRVFIHIVSTNDEGFGVKGTTLQNTNLDESTSIKIRKPLDFLPKALSSAPLQIEKLIKTLKTTPTKPTARINKDMVLLKTWLR